MDEQAATPQGVPVVPPQGPPVAAAYRCAICIRAGRNVAAVTQINGTDLCEVCARLAPRAALPYSEVG